MSHPSVTTAAELDALPAGSIFDWGGLIYRHVAGGGSICLEGTTGSVEYLAPSPSHPIFVLRVPVTEPAFPSLPPLSDTDLDQLEAYADAATPGLRRLIPGATRNFAAVNGEAVNIVPTIRRRDADLIVACAPETIKSLVVELRASRAHKQPVTDCPEQTGS